MTSLLARAASAPSGYKLPFPGGLTWQVIQGNNGAESHGGRSTYGWDFNMPDGAPITAARAGTVWMLKQDSNRNCRDLSCPELNNYVVIDHGDGTSGLYMHGIQNGARAKLGQRVEQGELIFLAGNTGQSNGSHLHFQAQYNDSRQYLAQSFKITFDDVPEDGGIPILGHWYQSGNSQVADFDIKNGHFFTQTIGGGNHAGTGFSVTDDGDIPMWKAFQSFGGAAAGGYPVSRRFQASGRDFTYQAFQKLVLEWHPAEKQMQPVNIMDLLHDRGLDAMLRDKYGLPVQADFAAADRDRSADEIMKAHVALLEAEPAAIKAAFFSMAPDPLARFGLPMSGIADMPDAFCLRTQRAVFQLWKRDKPPAKAGEVTLMNLGELARDAQLFPSEAFELEKRFNEEKSSDTRLPWQRGVGHGAGFVDH